MTGAEFLDFLVGASDALGMTDKNPKDQSYRAFMLKCLNLTIKDISGRQQDWHWRWLEKTATAPTVIDQMDYDLPSDLEKYKIFSVFDRTTPITYKFIPHEKFLRYVPKPSDTYGNPYLYTVWGDNLKLFPVPSSILTIYIKYIKTPTMLGDNDNTCDIPPTWDNVIIDGALRYAYQFDTELGDLTSRVQLYEAGISRMKQDNNMNINEITSTESHRGRV